MVGPGKGVSALVLALLLAAGCTASVSSPGQIVGSGRVISEGRALAAFSEVEVDGPIAAHITAGVDGSATVTADDNLVPLVTTTVTGGRLVIRLPSNTDISTTNPITVAVGIPALSALRGEAASHVTLDRLDSPDLVMTLEAASRVTGTGRIGHLTLQTAAASIAQLADVAVQRADVMLTAASIAILTASEAVRGEAHDASVLRVHGNPSVLSVQTSEMSRVLRE
jgi:hypothetical protein